MFQRYCTLTAYTLTMNDFMLGSIALAVSSWRLHGREDFFWIRISTHRSRISLFAVYRKLADDCRVIHIKTSWLIILTKTHLIRDTSNAVNSLLSIMTNTVFVQWIQIYSEHSIMRLEVYYNYGSHLLWIYYTNTSYTPTSLWYDDMNLVDLSKSGVNYYNW